MQQQNWTPINFRVNAESSVSRQLFIRKAAVNILLDGSESALLLTNIPPFVDDNCLQSAFGSFGKVVKVLFRNDTEFDFEDQKKQSKFFDVEPTSGTKYAAILFEDKNSVDKILSFAKSGRSFLLYKENEKPITGLRKYKIEYNNSIIDLKELKEDIDNYMRSYDAYVEEERRIAKEKEGVPDEDGWITVSRHGKRSFIPNNEFVDNLILSKKRKYDKVLTNFYNFQRTQTKIEGLSTLRSKFEEDKKRLAMMKATRKFKPL